ncbi:DUF5011 domain-containing protein, partial [Paenibacillus sepulcri]|nr:DUF5011 domain-containing protein [Paenibacillus sepulcri]
GQLYAEPGAAAADNLDGQLLPSTIAVTGIVDTNTMGPYELQYAASDTAGNTATVTRSVYVYDGESPIIRLNGPNPLVIAAGGSFTDPGATAFDAQEGDLTSAITVTGSVYANEVG